MKKLSADGSVPLNLKMPPDLGAKISETAKKSGQSNSAVIRAAIRLGLRALEVKPEMVRQIEAGTMDSGTLAEFVTRFALLCGYHVNPQTEQERTLAAQRATDDFMERTSGALDESGLTNRMRKAIIEALPEILSTDAALAVIRHQIASALAVGLPATPPPAKKAPAKPPKPTKR